MYTTHGCTQPRQYPISPASAQDGASNQVTSGMPKMQSRKSQVQRLSALLSLSTDEPSMRGPHSRRFTRLTGEVTPYNNGIDAVFMLFACHNKGQQERPQQHPQLTIKLSAKHQGSKLGRIWHKGFVDHNSKINFLHSKRSGP